MLSERDYIRNRHNRQPQAHESIIKPLIIANIIVFCFIKYTGSFGTELEAWLWLQPMAVQKLQFWRLFTYMFCHGSFFHLFFNMYGLFIFGKLLEAPLGQKRFLSLYFISGLIGAGLWLFFNWNSPYPCIGASGAVFGVMVASAMAFPGATFFLLFPPIPIKLWVLVWVYCLLEIFSSFNSQSNVAHLAHLGGALGGFIYMRRLGTKLMTPAWLQRFLYSWRYRLRHWKTSFQTDDKSNNSSKDDADSSLDSKELDRILDRMALVGYDALNEREKQLLRLASEQLKRRRT